MHARVLQMETSIALKDTKREQEKATDGQEIRNKAVEAKVSSFAQVH